MVNKMIKLKWRRSALAIGCSGETVQATRYGGSPVLCWAYQRARYGQETDLQLANVNAHVWLLTCDCCTPFPPSSLQTVRVLHGDGLHAEPGAHDGGYVAAELWYQLNSVVAVNPPSLIDSSWRHGQGARTVQSSQDRGPAHTRAAAWSAEQESVCNGQVSDQHVFWLRSGHW